MGNCVLSAMLKLTPRRLRHACPARCEAAKKPNSTLCRLTKKRLARHMHITVAQVGESGVLWCRNGTCELQYSKVGRRESQTSVWGMWYQKQCSRTL